jgi:hypothetical protein
MIRVILVWCLVVVGGCKEEDEGLRDTVPIGRRAARCMSMPKPPSGRCEEVARAFAAKALEFRKRAPEETFYISLLCKDTLDVGSRFAPKSVEVAEVKKLCCTLPDDQSIETIGTLCAPEYKKAITPATKTFNRLVRCIRNDILSDELCAIALKQYLSTDLTRTNKYDCVSLIPAVRRFAAAEVASVSAHCCKLLGPTEFAEDGTPLCPAPADLGSARPRN